jgi:hypothetical protein
VTLALSTRQRQAPQPFRSTAIFELFGSAFMTARQHSNQQVTDHPTNREPAHKSKRGAANTGFHSSAEDEPGSDRDGESSQRFVPDELVQMPPSRATPIHGPHRRIDATRRVRKHVV